MPISIFNPPCPHADPIAPGPEDDLHNNCCGKCVAVPRYWQVKFPPLDPSYEGSPGFDLTKIMFGQFWVLNRNLTILQTDGLCQWRCDVDVSAYYGPGPTGEWTIYYTTGAGESGWNAVAQTHTGDPATEFLAVYRFISGKMFKCFEPNELAFLPPPDSGIVTGVPPTVTIQPFWP